MKVALALVVLLVAVSQSDAWFRGGGFRGGFGGFGRWGLGWGAPWRWGGLGWGAGAWGVPPIGLGLGGIASPLGAGFIGKRDVDSVVPTVAPVVNRTMCQYSAKKNVLSCDGIVSFECDAVPNLVDIPTIRVQNLTVVPDEIHIGNVDLPIFRLFSRTDGGVLNNFSVLDKTDRHITFSVYNNEQLSKTETGIRIKDVQCWTTFLRVIREVVPETVRFSFFVDTVTKA